MNNVSAHFICIPLSFPCRPGLYRKLSQWLINCPGRSMGGGYIQCLLSREAHFCHRVSEAVSWKEKNNPDNIQYWSIVSTQLEGCQEINNKQEVAHVCVHVFTGTRGDLSAAFLCFFLTPALIGSRTLITHGKPHLWMWWLSSFILYH